MDVQCPVLVGAGWAGLVRLHVAWPDPVLPQEPSSLAGPGSMGSASPTCQAPLTASPDAVLRTSIAAVCGGAGDAGMGREGVSAWIPTICGLFLLRVLCLGSGRVLAAL